MSIFSRRSIDTVAGDVRVIPLLALAAGGLGALIAWSPKGALIAALLMLTVAVTVAFPLFAVGALILVLLLQDPLQLLVANDDFLSQAVQYSDDILIVIVAACRILFGANATSRIFRPSVGWSLAVCYLSLLLSTALNSRISMLSFLDLLLFSKPFFLLVIGASLHEFSRDRGAATLPAIPLLFAFQLPAIVFMVWPGLHLEYLGNVATPHERLGLLSATGLFLNPGSFGWLSAATFCLSYAAYLALARKPYLVMAIGSAVFAVLSWRRKSIVGILAVLLLSILLQGSGRQRIRTIAAILLAATAVLGVLVPFASALWERTVSEYGSTDPLNTARSALYYGSALIARDNFPLGAGFATYGSHASLLSGSDVYNRYGIAGSLGWGGRELRFVTDTYWPMVLGQGGVLGLAGILAFFGICTRTVWRAAVTRLRDGAPRFVTLAALFTLVASFSEAVASPIYGASMSSALVMIPLGLFLASEADLRPGARDVGGSAGTR